MFPPRPKERRAVVGNPQEELMVVLHLPDPGVGQGDLLFQVVVHRVEAREEGRMFLSADDRFGDVQANTRKDREDKRGDRDAQGGELEVEFAEHRRAPLSIRV